MSDNQVTWINQQGKTVVVRVKWMGYTAHIDGKEVAAVMGFSKVPMAAQAKAAQMGVVAFLGPVAITAEHKAKIDAIRATITPAIAPMPVIVEPSELTEINAACLAADEWAARHDENPAPAYEARDKADRAKAAWVRNHPAEWRMLQDARAAAQNQHIAEVRQSYMARGLD